MSILTLEFLVLVLALVVVNYCLPVRIRWIGLLGASLVFYGAAGLPGMIYMGVVTLVTWLAGLYMARCRVKEKEAAAENDRGEAWRRELKRKRWLRNTVVLVIGGMAFIKYYDLVYALINGIYVEMTGARTPLETISIIVPLGLSYFTFQSVGYVVDCSRGKVQPEKNPLKYLLFVSFFPQITQGPITTYKQLAPQLAAPARFEPANFVSGFQLMLWGYFKKMVLADRLAYVTNAVASGSDQPGWLILLGVIAYAIRLYGDFSGGMDVIRGVAKMLGIDVAENFKRPFFSISVAEYWRRWHISLGLWFRTYFFYPLTTSRFGLSLSKAGQRVLGKKIGRMLPGIVATFLIFFLIGVWHVANWNAVVYGVYFGLMLSLAMVLEPTFKKARAALHINPKAWWWKGFGLVRTLVLVLVAQYFAFTPGPERGFEMLIGTFQNWDFSGASELMFAMLDEPEWYIAGAAGVIVLIVDLVCEFGVDLNGKLSRSFFLLRWLVLILLIMAILILGCYGANFDAAAFLYTQF